jgi:DNA-directed RNA polymerase specialized sigma24 family protein
MAIQVEDIFGSPARCNAKRHYIARGLAKQLTQRNAPHTKDDLDELIQEVLLRVWKFGSRRTFENESAVMGYLAQVITTVASDFARAQGLRALHESVALEAPQEENFPDTNAQAEMSQIENSAILTEALTHLRTVCGDRLYQAFLFVYVEDRGTLEAFIRQESVAKEQEGVAREEESSFATRYATLRKQMSRATKRLEADTTFRTLWTNVNI